MLVVGGDSGGTRLNDVRFVYKYKYKYKYRKYKNTECLWWSNYLGRICFLWFQLQYVIKMDQMTNDYQFKYGFESGSLLWTDLALNGRRWLQPHHHCHRHHPFPITCGHVIKDEDEDNDDNDDVGGRSQNGALGKTQRWHYWRQNYR